MSNIPAWKRALLEKKKQQEQEEEQKKKQEKEAYIKSLPPWKRAILMRDMEKNKAAPASGNAPRSPRLAAAADKWKVALSQTNKVSSPASARKTEPSAKSSWPWSGEAATRTNVTNSELPAGKSAVGKPSWVRTDSPKSSTKPDSPTSETPETSSQRIIGERRGGSVQTIADQFHKDVSASLPPVSPVASVQQPAKREAKQQTVKQEATQQPATTTQAAPLPFDDSDLAGLPSWKRELIIKKRLKQAGLTAIPQPQQQQQSEPADKKTASSGSQETDSSQPASTKSAATQPSSQRSRPDVVNRTENDSSGSNKLVEKEGVTLHPPIFGEVDQWANVATDDPKFTQLPPWKQAMILRRRKDIAKRTGQETSPPESPTTPSRSDKKKASSSNSVSGSATENKKTNKKSPSKSSSGKTGGKKATTKTKVKEGEKKTATKTSNKSKANVEKDKSNVSTNKTNNSSGTSSRSNLKPVRAAPTKPPDKKTKEAPAAKEVKKEESKKKNNEEEEESMFTWSFSKHSVETGDALSNSSDSELEDVQITSIDDELSDEDDSGIGGSGGTILMSYKPLTDSVEEKKETQSTLKPPRERSLSTSSSDPSIQTMTKSESKSILVDPVKKSYKSLRRVSFSDSNLHTEHFYPKYDYSDYEDIEQELPDIFGRNKLRNAGLAHRLHPSLRTDSESQSDSYRYGFSGSNSSSPSPISTDSPSSNGGFGAGGGGGLSSYKPSSLSPFDSLASFSSPGHSTPLSIGSPIKEVEFEEASTDTEQTDDNSTDYYSSLNADTAALLW